MTEMTGRGWLYGVIWRGEEAKKKQCFLVLCDLSFTLEIRQIRACKS